MKKFIAALLVLGMIVVLCSCVHKHVWKDATCTEPKTCTECGEKEGEALGHTWKDATCTEPKTCTVCAETEGEALGHIWQDATCTEPKTCTVCGATEGEALGHTWQDATCTEPKTCTVCGETEGEALGHTWKDATCTEPKTCTVCGETEGEALGHTWQDATCTEPKTCTVCGETEGEALGHTWQDATCTEPKTCSVCGATEGEALGHTWQDATYAAPKTCTVCGQTDGDKIPSFFEKNRVDVGEKPTNLTIKAAAADHENNPSRVEFPEVKIALKSNTVAPSQSREGYTTHTLVYEFSCIAPAFAEGYSVDMGAICDYYTGYVFEDRTSYESNDYELYDSVTLDGVKYTVYYAKNVDWSGWEWSTVDNAPVATATMTYQIDVPDGYDGLVLFFADQTEWVLYKDNETVRSYELDPSDLSNKYFFFVAS